MCCTVMRMKFAARTVSMRRARRCVRWLRNRSASAMPCAGNAVCTYAAYDHVDDDGD